MLFRSTLYFLFVTVFVTFAVASPVLKKRQEDYAPVRGVNLGGLFVLEPWITPSLFEGWANEPNSTVVDEWNYCKALGKAECKSRLEVHWGSWVQEADVAALARMHINTIRIPIGYWALAPDRSDPYVQGQLPYLERILGWAGRYRMRVILDLHGVPGSQNGFDNSGERGDIRWTKGINDIQRSLDSLAVLANIANAYPSVVAIQAVNEPANWGVPKSTIIQFYNMAYSTIKSIAPRVAVDFHDAFLPPNEWSDVVPLNLTDSLLDTHIYHVFVEDQLRLSPNEHIEKACNDGRNIGNFNTRTRTICGEFSLATTDCARWLNGFQRGARWDGTYLTKKPMVEGASCQGKERLEAWSKNKKQYMRKFAMAQLQAYEMGSGWIFWNFKTESADAWNYMKLVDAGIIPNPPIGSSFNIC
ncbi:hypothetical protein IW140_003727 [Coemansia sp. RSA 1813]|nr:hypothetical protein EV178_003692 [Coemansia sp. RSA 1646]KAJ1768876.1 hypothetical protein LPJ74_004520 [Coemansia sp. RSA 1843]KAJ2088731.1 hypothetical protein IW138_004003 [Coemansia sp. RSA 986]KAJ2213650.1 hypothetical protein EV179_003650 [Coemansia sp. RSA 487]KAJ2568633.1 hypothetical protein IW140_003727 [Coemansia sp. RSA 1813]